MRVLLVQRLFLFQPVTKDCPVSLLQRSRKPQSRPVMLSHISCTHGCSRVFVRSQTSSTIQYRKLKSSMPSALKLEFDLWSWKKRDSMLQSKVYLTGHRRLVSRSCCQTKTSNNVLLVECPEDVKKTNNQVSKSEELIETIRSMFFFMGDGETGVSPYDTAWVSLVVDAKKAGVPQFPTALDWILENQHTDGSWGDFEIFSAHDRIINTLACIVALKSWGIAPLKIKRGLKFILENTMKLADENVEHMPIAFEFTFPKLLEMAKRLDLEVPIHSSFTQSIYAVRNIKLKRIPKDTMHSMPTSLLFTLEGIDGLDWEKLLRFQSADGSFYFSPSSTVITRIYTRYSIT